MSIIELGPDVGQRDVSDYYAPQAVDTARQQQTCHPYYCRVHGAIRSTSILIPLECEVSICFQVLRFVTIGAGGDSVVKRPLVSLSDDFTVLTPSLTPMA